MTRSLLQISAAQGPDECCLAVLKACDAILLDARQRGIRLRLIESCAAERAPLLRSALFELEEGDVQQDQQENVVEQFLKDWCGTCQWICSSPFRPRHRRKNWFFSIRLQTVTTTVFDEEIRYESCRASGPGGQHVNKTDTAVRATHLSTGLSVKVQSERSQLANKRLATLLLQQRLQEVLDDQQRQSQKDRYQAHYDLQRGEADHVFCDLNFKRKR